jgi:hypothetical protein
VWPLASASFQGVTVHRSSDSVQVVTAAPLLRVVLIVVLLLAAVAGVLVVDGSQSGWVALGLSLVVGPVAVVIEGGWRKRGAEASTQAEVLEDGLASPGRVLLSVQES